MHLQVPLTFRKDFAVSQRCQDTDTEILVNGRKILQANSNGKAPGEPWGTLFKSKFLPEDAETLNFFLSPLDK